MLNSWADRMGHCSVCGKRGKNITYICNECRASEKLSTTPYNVLTITDSDGGIYSGYNVGLDAVVKNRGHYKELKQSQGVHNADEVDIRKPATGKPFREVLEQNLADHKKGRLKTR